MTKNYEKNILKYGARGDRMNIKMWTSNKKNYKIKRNEGGNDMATMSFDREIILNDTSAEALIKKIQYDRMNIAAIKDINIEKKLEEGKKLLKQLFSR